MGLLDLLGLNDIADGIRDFTTEIDGLKSEIIDSVIGPGEELKDTVNDITGSLANDITPLDASNSDAN